MLNSNATPTRSYNERPRHEPDEDLRDAQLVVVLDSQQPQRASTRISLARAHEVELRRAAQRSIYPRIDAGHRRLCVGLPDPWMSARHARLVRRGSDWLLEDTGSKNGTQLNGVPTADATLCDGDVIETGGTFLLFSTSARRPDEPALLDTDELADQPAALVTLNLALARQFDGLRRVAASMIPVVVTGESGTGKELTVRALHELSGRGGPLVAVNCGAIPATLLHAELFGCVRGAYTGADTDRAGLIGAADGGTLFLDEIAELPEASQAALLRFLQDGEVRPVGAATARRIDVRVVAATHDDLEQRVRDGRFRRDLYARLCGYRLDLPPLRERREDLGTLIRSALCELAPALVERAFLRQSAARALFSYDFPLNIRELRHALQTALVLSDDGALRREHLPNALTTPRPGSVRQLSSRDRALRADVDRRLRANGGNVSAVAREMGKAPVQIRRWCRRFAIDLAALRRPG